MSPGIKVFIEFNDKFFYDSFGYSHHLNDENQNEEQYFYNASYGQNQQTTSSKTSVTYVLGMFAVGSPALAYTNKEKSEILKILLDELDTMYGENQIATKSFTGNYIVQNWVKDEPYIRGVYSNYYRKYKYMPELRKPISGSTGNGNNQRNQIYFAGEAFPVNYNDGYVHTAALSGKAAAYQIMNGETSAIKRQLKKLFDKY